MKKRTFLSVGVLVVSRVAVRAAGLIYKLLLSARLSPVSLGLYQMAMNLGGFFITPAVSGLPKAAARLTGKYGKDSGSIPACAARLGLLVSGVSALILLLFRNPLAGMYLRAPDAGGLLAALAPAVLFGGVSAVLAAYLTARDQAGKTALAEVTEQAVKIGAALLLLTLFPSGENAVLPAWAVSIGAAASLILLLAFCGPLPKPDHHKEVIRNAWPPTVTRCVTALTHLVNTSLLPTALMAYGLSREAALGQYGILTGMTYPVVFLPLTVTGALSTVLLPRVAAGQNDPRGLKPLVRRSFLAAAGISAGFCALLLLFGPALAGHVFHQPLAGRYMILLLPSVLFSGVRQVAATVLGGLGRNKTLMALNIADGIFGILLTVLLVFPFGMTGFLLANGIQDLTAFLLTAAFARSAMRKEEGT